MIINMVGGGGGFAPSNAIVGVTAYAGSTVTISNGTVTKTVTADKSHVLSDLSSFAIYYFGIPSGMFSSSVPWNIVAEYQGEETTATIIVNTNAFYDIVLTYRVPYDYQEVEYLESNGSQYIDTLIPTDSIGEMKAKIMLKSSSRSTWEWAFGGSDGSKNTPYYNNNGFGLMLPTNGNIYFQVNNQNYAFPSSMYNFNYIGDFSLSSSNNDITFSLSIPPATPVPVTWSSIPITSNRNFYLFIMNFSDGVNLSTTNGNRFYSCEITNKQNQIVSNLIPCYRKSDSVAGMYDNVNHRFLTNQGTGTFVVGSDVNS